MSSSGEVFQQVRGATDIVQLIGEHVALKRAGREFVCLCPFHDDHSPSMRVVPHKQIFYCFVCATGGDVFRFVQLYHKMTPGESLRYLAQKVGIALPERTINGPARAEAADQREELWRLNELACQFFQQQLKSSAGAVGRNYLLKRGLTDATLEEFRLGFAPEGWTGLVNAALRWKTTPQRLVEAGLVKLRGDGSPYDLFRRRVIFPILDPMGRVLAFGGRMLPETGPPNPDARSEAKYLNSPETPLFNKSQSLYGLYQAKSAILKADTAVVVEGYMDVIACYQAGVHHVVATLGTALTGEHARQLRRFCQNVILVFDSDDAGHRAADRALEMFVQEPLDIRLTSVSDGKDPCDFCMTHGGEAFGRELLGAQDAMTYQWKRLEGQMKKSPSLSGRQEAILGFMGYLAKALGARPIDPVRRGLLISKVAGVVGLTLEEVQQRLMELGGSGSGGQRGAAQPAAGGAASKVLRGSPGAQAWVLGALLSEPTLYERVRGELSLELFTPAGFQALAEALLEYLEHAMDLASCSLADFLTGLSPELMSQAIELQAKAEVGGKLEQKLADALGWLQARRPPEESPEGLSEEQRLQQTLEAKRGAKREAERRQEKSLMRPPQRP